MAEGFLEKLSRAETDALQAVGMPRTYGRHVEILHEGDDAGAVVVLLRGRVKVATISAGGREAIVAVGGPGDLLGELAAIDGGRRSTNVTTLEPVELLLIPRSDFLRLIDERPRMAVVILRMVAGRLGYADAQQAQLATHDVADVPGGDRELGRRLTGAREQGLAGPARFADIETGRRRITVLDFEALERHAH
jgi:CRP-like cAMP-binding protein